MTLPAMAQVAAEAAKNPTLIQGAGRILIDGTIIVAMLKLAEAAISKWQRRPGGSKAIPPKPGEGKICEEHLAEIKSIRSTLEEHGRDLAGYKEFKANTAEALHRIESKVDDLKDLIIGRERA